MSRSEVAARRAKAISLISAGVVHSQEDLVQGLKKAGFKVTQATASRDLEEVGAIRSRAADGGLVYSMPTSAEGALAKSMPLPAELIIAIESSANIAVVKTPPGGAQLLASSLDHIGLNHVIGTIAGDDTVLVISKKATGGAQLAKELALYKRTQASGVRTGKRSSSRKPPSKSAKKKIGRG